MPNICIIARTEAMVLQRCLFQRDHHYPGYLHTYYIHMVLLCMVLLCLSFSFWCPNKFNGLAQDYSNSIANALELLQSCTKSLIYNVASMTPGQSYNWSSICEGIPRNMGKIGWCVTMIKCDNREPCAYYLGRRVTYVTLKFERHQVRSTAARIMHIAAFQYKNILSGIWVPL